MFIARAVHAVACCRAAITLAKVHSDKAVYERSTVLARR